MVWRPQLSFRNGEISPHMDGMSSDKVYESSCRKLEGAIVSSSGTIEKRAGTDFLGELVNSEPVAFEATGVTGSPTLHWQTAVDNGECKLIPYKAGGESYVLAFYVESLYEYGVLDLTAFFGFPGHVDSTMFSQRRIIAIKEGSFAAASWVAGTYNFPMPGGYAASAIDNPHEWAAAATQGSPATGGPVFTAGVTNTTSFGVHPYSATQLSELYWFQHQDTLVVCHPEQFPMQITRKQQGDGSYLLEVSPYKIPGHSPAIDNRGERFTMTPDADPGTLIALAADMGQYETTRDFWTDLDVRAIYRVGYALRYPIAGHTAYTSDGRGLFAQVKEVKSPKKAILKNLSVLEDWEFSVDDPFDWEGPWVELPVGEIDTDNRGLVMSGSGTDPANLISYDTPRYHEIILNEDVIGGLWAAFSDYKFSPYDLVGCIIEILSTDDHDTAATVAVSDRHFGIIAGVLPEADQVGTYPQAPTVYVMGLQDSDATHGFGMTEQRAVRLYVNRERDRSTLLPTVTVSPKYGPVDEASDHPYDGFFEVPQVGSEVEVYVGNTVSGDELKTIPTEHGTHFDTTGWGELSGTAVGGTIHYNGGIIAIESQTTTYVQETTGGSVPITSYGYTGRVIVPPTHFAPTSKFSLGWSPAVGFPSCGVSHQNRVFFSGFKARPQVVVASVIDSEYDFSTGGTAVDGIHFIVTDLRGGQVRWLANSSDLLVGTDSAEFSIGGSPLSALSVGVDRHSSYGSAGIKPVIIGTYMIFVQKDKKTLRAMKWQDDSQRYMSMDITEPHRHMFKSATIVDMVVWEVQQEPILVVLLSDGEVLSCRIHEKEGFFAWSRMKLPANCNSLSPAMAPPVTGEAKSTGPDDLYFSFDTTSGVERPSSWDNPNCLDVGFEGTGLPARTDGITNGNAIIAKVNPSIYVDQAVTPTTITSSPIGLVLTGNMGHLIGQEVSVVVDGVYKGEETVEPGTGITTEIPVAGTGMSTDGFSGEYEDYGGSVTVSRAASGTTVFVGKKIDMLVQPRVPEVGVSARSVSTLGRQKNYSSAIVNLNASKAVKVNGYWVEDRFIEYTAPEELTGWSEVPVAGLYGVQPLLEISSDRPYPVEIAGVTIDVSVEG